MGLDIESFTRGRTTTQVNVDSQIVTIDLRVVIETSQNDGLLVLADALLGELDKSLENVHEVKVLSVTGKVNGKSIYTKDGKLRP